MTLRERLIIQNRIKWLDVGCGNENPLEAGFSGIDILPLDQIDEDYHNRYSQVNILTLTDEECKRLGAFDLVRLQHVIEHFTFEDAQIVLKNCARLLKIGGFILVSGPDLDIHISHYLAGDYTQWWQELFEWNVSARLPFDATPSDHFAMFAYNILSDPHLWCYNREGIERQIERTGCFSGIEYIHFGAKLASEPFTHNRPKADFCVMAIRK